MTHSFRQSLLEQYIEETLKRFSNAQIHCKSCDYLFLILYFYSVHNDEDIL